MAAATKWLPLFEEFIGDLRISSKEEESEDDAGVPLVLWESQRRFLREIAAGLDLGVRIFYCLKSRQLGVTTVSLAIDLFWLAMHNNLTAAIVTEDEANRDKNRKVLRQYIRSFPADYFGKDFFIVKGGDNRNSMTFSNGSRIDWKVAGTRNKGSAWAEGEGYAMAHLTEVASYGSADALESFEESFAQKNPVRLYIYESTAKGFNIWREKWYSGFDDEYTKRSFFIGWWASDVNRIERSDPRYLRYGASAASGAERELLTAVRQLYGYEISAEQLAWIRWKEDTSKSDSMLQQNQPWIAEQAFVMSGFSFFQTRIIALDHKKIIDANEREAREPGFESPYGFSAYRYEVDSDFFEMKLVPLEADELDQVELKIWEEPVEDAEYVVGMDPAWGRNEHGDRHCISVWRCYADKLVQVAEYATADVEVKHSAWVLAHICGAYNDIIANVELTGPGRVIMLEWDHLRALLQADINYAAVRARDWENALGMARWYLYNRPDTMGRGYAANFETTWRTKQELMHGFRGSYVTRELEIRSLRMLEEMRIVVQDGAEIGAPESSGEDSKDDRVFAAALAHRAWVNWRRPGLLARGLTWTAAQVEEQGRMTLRSRSLNGIVQRFLMTRELQEREADHRPAWMVERGLM